MSKLKLGTLHILKKECPSWQRVEQKWAMPLSEQTKTKLELSSRQGAAR